MHELSAIQDLCRQAEEIAQKHHAKKVARILLEVGEGTLYHRYQIDEAENIRDARIVPPTSQNQRTIENDLEHFVPMRLDLPEAELTWQCEQAIRNYDPCISCATHFLKLELSRE